MDTRRMKKRVLLALLLALLFLFAACAQPTQTPGPSGGAESTPTQGPQEEMVVPTKENTGIPQWRAGTGELPGPNITNPEAVSYNQALRTTDYTYMWWPEGWHGALRQTYIMSAKYGLSVNPLSGTVVKMGAFAAPVAQADAMGLNNALVADLPALRMKYAVNEDGKDYPFTGMQGLESNAQNNTRMLESGRYMQRIDAMGLRFKDRPEICGRLEVMALPDYFSLQFEIYPENTRMTNVTLTFSLELDKQYTKYALSADGRVLAVANAEGAGFAFVAAKEEGIALSLEGTVVTVTKNVGNITRNTFKGFGVRVIPSAHIAMEDAYEAMMAEEITLETKVVSPQAAAGKTQKVTKDMGRGLYEVSLNNLFSKVPGEVTDADLNTYDRVTLTFSNPTATTVRIPVAFTKDNPLPVTGISPMLVNTETGEPIGIPVQFTRNWHGYSTQENSGYEYASETSPKRYWEGYWFHGYTVIEVPAGKTVQYDYVSAFGQWGTLYAASHSQLCLAGWGGNLQQWESASLGSFGESFCYDISRSLTWCNMGDICAVGLYSRVDGKKYNWTGNIGGGDFLGYFTERGTQVQMSGMKTYFKNQGPNLTEVLYSGVTADGAIRVEITVNMSRTDDSAHGIHTLRYTWLKDTTFSRLFFYQMSADSYNYDFWKNLVVGNNNGPVPFTVGGTSYGSGVMPVPISEKNEYIGGGGMNQINVPGEGMWLGYMNAQAGKSYGNKVLAVHAFNAVLNGKAYSKPTFSIRTTNVLQWKGAVFELNPPKEVGNKITAGSSVEMIVDYITLPAYKSEYYGPSTVLAGVPAADYENHLLLQKYATSLYTKVTAAAGEVVRNYPAKLKAEKDGAQFTITGGLGYMPVTVTGLSAYSGWKLEVKEGGAWQQVDQSVRGNDYWQTEYEAETGTYALTYNVFQNNDAREYRLVRK